MWLAYKLSYAVSTKAKSWRVGGFQFKNMWFYIEENTVQTMQ